MSDATTWPRRPEDAHQEGAENMLMALPMQGKGPRWYWICAAAALMLIAPQAHAQINPFVGRHEPRLSGHDLGLLMSSINQVNHAPAVAIGMTASWSNPNTGDHGTSTVKRIFQEGGMTCHLLQHEIFSGGEPQPRRYDLTWCLTADGEWKILK